MTHEETPEEDLKRSKVLVTKKFPQWLACACGLSIQFSSHMKLLVVETVVGSDALPGVDAHLAHI